MRKQRDNSFTGFVSPKGEKWEQTVSLFRSQEGALQIGLTRNQHMLFNPRAEPTVAKSQTQLRAGLMRRNDEFTKDSAVSRKRTRSQTHTRLHHNTTIKNQRPNQRRGGKAAHYKVPQVNCLAFVAPLLQRNAPLRHHIAKILPWTTTPHLSPWPDLPSWTDHL